jgi:hypothetical protein
MGERKRLTGDDGRIMSGWNTRRLLELLCVVACCTLLLLLGGVSGCSRSPIRLAPHPLWLQSGKEIRDGFLVCPHWKSSIRAKYLAKEEVYGLLRSRSEDPALFDSSPNPWMDSVVVFLLSATNDSSISMLLEAQYAVLQDSKGRELRSVDLADLYLSVSEEKVGLEKMKVLMKLLFSSLLILPGESKEGLLFFRAPKPSSGEATLRVSFAFTDRTQEKLECIFPFAVEKMSPEGSGATSP